MRYYSYNEYDADDPRADESGGWVATVSEEDIRKEYYPYWYKKMCDKFGKEHVDKNYHFEDCITDFCIIHWAWEVK